MLVMLRHTEEADSFADMPSSQKEHFEGLGGKELGYCQTIQSFVHRLELRPYPKDIWMC